MDPHVNRPARSARASSRAGTLVRLGAFAVVAAASAPAPAAPCAGFTDVDGASGFCADVQWIRNRAITQGCTVNAYCPNDAVTRLQMAAFMSRLGKVLQPAFLTTHEFVTGIDNAGATVLCQLDAPAATYPRVASSSSSMIEYSSGVYASIFVQLAVSTDQGATWTPWSQRTASLTTPVGTHGTVSPAAPPIGLPAGQTMRFGIQPLGSMGAQFYDLSCEFTVRLDSAPDMGQP